MSGTLFVVATPLGHLDDLSPRGRATLAAVDWVACEDTRRTGRLLARLGLDRPTISYHRFNERSRLEPLLERLTRGENGALVSDGGTPGISDPGALLVRAALDRGVRVSPVPGPSAMAALLGVSGLGSDRFVFEGFLPHRAGERRRRLRELRVETRTVVLYEAPHRIRDSLGDIDRILGARRLVLGRELTKIHETLVAGNARELLDALPEPVKGEITLAIEGGSGEVVDDEETAGLRNTWQSALEAAEGDRRRALRAAARSLGLARDELRRRLDELEASDEPGSAG